ncbi:vacuole membrane protein 1 isoform X3 [Agrilus planipennis]|nr:vacuole membrane protein 1 isoform X3 [Agrilus planipennis]XP_018326636.1 vacuole membrane protein 1 isoform X3 [Agrilus planipennis]
MSGNAKVKEPTANGNSVFEIASNKKTNSTSKHKKQGEKLERESLVLWRRPLKTLEYFFKEVFVLLYTYGNKLLQFKKTVLVIAILLISLTVVSKTAGPHQYVVQEIYKTSMWCFYWIGLGILSSVGLGTGLHTFLLYLGPHIAQVTLAAYECGSLNFPEPPYPDDIVCPNEADPSQIVSIWSIMSKVRLEAMCWGAGTALGELPPYFMARAARLSGYDPDDDDELREFEELQRKEINRENLTLMEKGKLFVEHIVQKVGFLGILACASIPNPLFDLAGITCGHFLVPFWTFFGATLIGKAIIKMHIQKLFVIIAFNETLISTAVEWLAVVPVIGIKLQEPFKAFLESQKLKLHRQRGSPEIREKGSLLSSVFEKFVVAMILYFVVSIINSLAQSYHKRLHKKKIARSD